MRKTVSVLIAAVVALGLGGCGDDDDDGGETSAEDSTATTETTGAEDGEGGGEAAAATPTGGDLQKYCDLSASLEESFPEDADADTPEEQAAILKQHYEDHEGEYEDIVEAAPDEIEEDAAKAVELLKRLVDGDLTALEDPAFDEVDGALGDFGSEHCAD